MVGRSQTSESLHDKANRTRQKYIELFLRPFFFKNGWGRAGFYFNFYSGKKQMQELFFFETLNDFF